MANIFLLTFGVRCDPNVFLALSPMCYYKVKMILQFLHTKMCIIHSHVVQNKSH